MDNHISVLHAAKSSTLSAREGNVNSNHLTRPLFEQDAGARLAPTSRITQADFWTGPDWQPIWSMPRDVPVIVGNKSDWTLAKRKLVGNVRLRWRGFWFKWVYVTEEVIVFANATRRPIPFEPTHWRYLGVTRPPDPEGDARGAGL